MESRELTLEQGEYLVWLARRVIETYLSTGERMSLREPPEWAKGESGVFVTLRKMVPGGGHELRGCIGYPEPMMPLYKALISAALASALEDPRFPEVKLHEMDSIIVEVSVLTKPTKIELRDRRDLPKAIRVGKDGLIARRGFRSGLLLPQVPVEEGWDVEEFLCYTCIKAGLPPDCWLDEETEFYSFSAVVFSEESPRGRVKRVEL